MGFIDVKNVFYVFFYSGHVFNVFFYFSNVFYFIFIFKNINISILYTLLPLADEVYKMHDLKMTDEIVGLEKRHEQSKSLLLSFLTFS